MSALHPRRPARPALFASAALLAALGIDTASAGEAEETEPIAPVVGLPGTADGLVESLTIDTAAGDVPLAGKGGGEWVFAPIPIAEPSLGTGLGLVALNLFSPRPSDTESPPSVLGFGGMATDNGSWAAGVGAKLHFARDRYRLTAAFGLMDLQYDFYGLGSEAGDRGLHVPLQQEGHAGGLGFLRRVKGDVFLGLRYQLLDMSVALDLSDLLDPEEWEFPTIQRDSRAAAVGLQVQRDTRDSSFYPKQGSYLTLDADFFDDAFGSDHDVEVYTIAFNQYRRLGSRGVLAWRANARSAHGERIPFYLLSRLGSSSLRGYGVGRYQDDAMAAAQAEYRLELPKRMGLAFFAGFGGVGPALDDLDDLLPSAGIGLRWTAAKKSHVNLRVDVAWGENGSAVHIGVGEAF